MFSLLSPTLTWWEILSTKDIAALQSETLLKMISIVLFGEIFLLYKKKQEQNSDHWKRKNNFIPAKNFMACSPPLYS